MIDTSESGDYKDCGLVEHRWKCAGCLLPKALSLPILTRRRDFFDGRKRERIVLSALSGAEVARLGLVAVVWLGTSYSRARTLTLRGSNPNVALLLYVIFFPSPPIIFITSFPCHHDSPRGDPTSACNPIAHALARTIPTISDESFQPLRSGPGQTRAVGRCHSYAPTLTPAADTINPSSCID